MNIPLFISFLGDHFTRRLFIKAMIMILLYQVQIEIYHLIP